MISHFDWDPGKQAVRNNVIKLSPRCVDVQDIALNEAHILDPQITDHLLPDLNRTRGEVNAHEFAFRKTPGYRNKIGAVSAAEFERSATSNRRGLQAEQRADSRQSIRMSLRVGVTGIKNMVVS